MDAVGLNWVGSVGSEGGPILVAEPGTFAEWFGGTSFDELEERFPGDSRITDRRRTLYYHGELAAELPDPYTVQKGVWGVVERATDDAAKAVVDELYDAVLALRPDAEVRGDDRLEELRFVTLDNGALLTIDVPASSQYQAVYKAQRATGKWYQTIGEAHVLPVGHGLGLFYEFASGVSLDVGLSTAGDEIVFVSISLSVGDEDDEDAAMRAYVEEHRASEEGIPDEDVVGEFSVAGEQLIAIWSAVGCHEVGPLDHALAALGSQEAVKFGDGLESGMALRVQPGRYRVSTFENDGYDPETDEEHWECRGLRLVKVG